MTLRHVRLTVSARGHRTQTITLVKTLLDPLAYPLRQLGELYLQRWSVEFHFREIKITLGMDVLRCKTPAMVEKEVMMHAVSCNLVRSLMQEAAVRHQVDLTRISFKGTVGTLRHWSASLEAMRGMPRKQKALLDTMFEIIATLRNKLRGVWNYYGVIGKSERNGRIAWFAQRLVYKWLNRHSQRRSYNMTAFMEAWERWKIPMPCVVEKPWPHAGQSRQNTI